ncbi:MULTISPECIES: hypothetical protein [unclassified Okeania]|nr:MULTISPECIES: hypothetical protein [unclassified Okeania]NES74584.1 hypothetical protein [Okeania sp. SIO1H4]NET18656.1 hypothetical protein [Okeania sp. SIO1H5]NET92303.1 hypothetical protein [Okeania sp. SIO1H2]
MSVPCLRSTIEPVWYLHKYQVFLVFSQETGDRRQETGDRRQEGRCGER